jgi:spermidine synthase
MTTRVPVGVFFALFTISGFAGLIYQSIWSHYLKLFLGHAAYAQTLVLGIFMGGMAIGSWLVSRYTHRIRNLLLGYAIAELGIGILALVFHRVFQAAIGWAFDTVMPELGGTGVDLFKWTLASALILPASVLLGTTFPLMSAGILRVYPDAGGRALSMLYFTNSFGAAIGVLVSGFYLIDRVGLPGTIFTAGILNVVLGLVVWLIAKKIGSPAVTAPTAQTAEGARAGRSITRAILLLAFATGAASFIYEITWIRMLTLGLGASTHAFEVMLAAFILAMSLGAFWFRNRIGRLRNDMAWLAGLLFAKAFLAVYAIWIYSDVLNFIQWMMLAVSRSDGGYVLTTFAGLVASMLVMFPTAFCAGMTLPLATHALTSRGLGEASIGKVYGANTAGCILGAALATHVGMESLGVKGLTGLGALFDVAVGAFLLFVTAPPAQRARAIAIVAVLFVAGAVGFHAAELDLLRMSSGVFRSGVFNDPRDSRVVFYRDGKTATISVVDLSTLRTIRTNGKPDASVERDPKLRAAPDESTMVLVGALPLALKPDAQLIANIGFGSGITTHTLLGSPRVRELDSIEIERVMVEGAKFFHPRNRRAYEDPRSRIHIDDAKTYFASAGRRYDIIVSEPSNPWVSGVSTLFSEEFYGQVKRYLKDDGLLVQWLQAYEIDVGLLSTIFNALGRHFGDYTVYSADGFDLLVVATPAGRLPELGAEVFEFPGIRDELAYLGYERLSDLQMLRVAGRKTLEPLFRQMGYPPNSDYFPILDQRAPRARFKNQDAGDLANMRTSLVPVLPLLDGEWRTPLERIMRVGKNRSKRLDLVVLGAEAVGVAVGGEVEGSKFMLTADRGSALLAHAMLENCKGAQSAWMDQVTGVARLAMPALEAKDVAVLFEKARASRCARSLDEVNARRLALLQAINDRDAESMVRLAESALQNLPEAMEKDRGYYLSVAMAGLLAKGRVAEARALSERHGPRLTPAGRGSLVMRLLDAHAAAGAGSGVR